MPSVEVAALPGFALPVSMTSRHHLYVRRARTRSVTRLRKNPENHEDADGVIENIRNTFERLGAMLNELGDARILTAQSVALEGYVVDPVNWAVLR
jgi:hypothetical protein